MTIGTIVGLALFAEDAHEAADEGAFNPILPTLPEIIWSAACFFALWALLKYVLLPPIVKGRDERQARVAAGQDSVSDSESELAQLRAAHDERISAAKAEAASIMDTARAEAEGQRAQAVAEVEGNIAQLKANAQAEIDAARTAALAGAKGSVSELAVGAASKVLGRSVDAGASQSVIDAFLNGQGN